ncbi:hypothetical protein AQUCO_14800006v1 [Aquilegia coerulea]|uniref:Rx N-terminal domain-containing protein n=1 Tax=Aquilegia coerulea TaxID=218851 RepID=A0A2G5C0T9_AQUCA|nr:hypothetical protein AQUCO_14800006v1 [Aquilegia coerulea]
MQVQLHEQFKKIEKELRDAGEVFPRVKNWENFVTNKFDSIEQDLEDMLDECKDLNEFETKFQSILKKVEEITTMNSEIQLHSIPSGNLDSSQTPQSMSNAKNVSVDWQRLRIEESILENTVMANLQVSYDILEPQLKLCLLCFSIFPDNSEIKKRPVIYWWIGEGIVTHTRDTTAEEVGEGIFTELTEKGMIEPVYKNKSPMVTSYLMHPWIRLMVVSVAKKARFFDFDDAGKPMADCPISRRACLVLPTDTHFQLSGERQPITLFNVNQEYLHVNLGWFSKQKKLVVLQLGRWQNSDLHHIEVDSAEFLKGLEEQIQLKYLSLCGISRITQLPDSIAKLTNLKILDLRACHNLEELPSTIKAMKKLSHLDVSECYLLENMPKGLGLLSNLEVLKGFVIGNSRSKDPCQLKEWGGVVHSAPTESTKLMTRAAAMTMKSLSMPQNLWLRPSNLKNLERLYIKGGKLHSLQCEDNEAWNVKILRLKFLKYMEMNWSVMQKVFPRLVYLEKIKCDNLESFKCDKNGVWMNDKDEKICTNTL